MCNVTLRSVRSTIVTMEIQCVLHILSALGIQHAMRMRRIVICGLPGSTGFLQICLIKDVILEKKY